MSPVLLALIAADVPLLLWGPPGAGKTSMLLAAALAAGAHAEVLIGSTLDPMDVGGVSVPTPTGLVLHPPAWARAIRAHLDAGRPAWLILDELSCCPAPVQAALLRVVQDRAVAGVSLRGCRIVGAANPADTAADGGWLAPASANRWAHVSYTVAAGDWCGGELAGWGSERSQAHAAASASVVAYIHRQPAALCGTPGGEAWPSPRAWSAAAAALAYLPTRAGRREIVAACVGHAAAAEWARVDDAIALDLPDPDELLAGRVAMPERGDVQSACAMAIVAAVLSSHPDREARITRGAEVLASLRPDRALVAAGALVRAIGTCPPELLGLAGVLTSARQALA